MAEGRRVGDFNNQAVVAAFDFHIADLDENVEIHGLGQRAIWPFGGLRNEAGNLYVLERKLVHQMTGGLWLMSDKDGDLNLVPKAVHSARGELRRELTPGRRIYRDHLMAKLGDLAPAEEQSFYFDITDDALVWQEGELCDLSGRALGPGMHLFDADREWPFMYITRAFWTTGTVMGEAVSGIIWCDHGYWRDRGEWKEQPFYTEKQVAWNVFSNQYDDGTHEWGHIVRGTGGLGACMVAGDETAVATTGNFESSFVLDDQDYVSSARYRASDQEWEFTADPAGRMLHFNKARWAGYRAQSGAMRRVGDTRKVVNAFVWLECFADRIRAEGLAKKD
ncbi:MAG: hypothetical protein AB1679_10125 [Actinomycetota bacterium]|jgi:hypothetical protein